MTVAPSWKDEISSAVADFEVVAKLGGIPLQTDDCQVEYLPAPHRPPSRLPSGKMAVYAFWGDNCWLKVGMAGPNSNARYTSQHYNAGSAPSTLAASLVNALSVAPICDFDPVSPGAWIRQSTHRVNVLIPSTKPRELLALLEAFLHLRLRPRHER